MGQAIGEIPKGILAGAGALMLFTLAAAGTARVTGMGVSSPQASPIVAERLLRFELEPGGGVRAIDARSAREVVRLGPHDHGFVRVVVQGVTRERMLAGVEAEAPLLLRRHADERMRLHDPETGQTVMLGAFGAGNHQAFAQLFNSQERTAP